MDAANERQATASWHTSLNSRESWNNPVVQYKYLVRYADKLHAAGTIDPFERFELVELAFAAFCHFVEEQPQRWLHPASEYDVYNQAGIQVGSLSGSRYFLHAKGVRHGPIDFFAQLQEKDGEQKLITRTYIPYGILQNRYILTETGQRLVLVEIGRRFDGQMRTRIDDPDAYRAIVDASTNALERGNMTSYVKQWEREGFAIYIPCSTCRDRFYLREDCDACSGLGFVEDPHCPSRLPPGWTNAVVHPNC